MLIRRISLAIVLLAIGTFVGVGSWFWTSLPQASGWVAITGLAAPVSVTRDSLGVPRIAAKNWPDAYHALGFVHAQDRLWQMEAMRRFGAGRLAEVVGPEAVASDKWMRTLGLHRLAADQVSRISKEARRALAAYAAGVNSFIDNDGGMLTPEFSVLGYRPEPWTPADSLVWGKIMAMRLGGNWRDELLRARLAKRLGIERVEELWPAVPGSEAAPAPVRAAALQDLTNAARVAAGALSTPAPVAESGASNVWALAPSRTPTGGALLANDPHLGFSAPIMWYLAAIETPDGQLVGATVPGVPFTILGHNGHLAWGFTTTQADFKDLVVERLAPGSADRYETPNGPRPFQVRSETIAVRGASPIALDVRWSRHGPVISDLSPATLDAVESADRHVLVLQATFLRDDDRTPEALYRLNRAEDSAAFRAALEDFHSPQQNVLFADTLGGITLFAPGRVPIRPIGNGRWPISGWDGRGTWQGFASYGLLPRIANPGSGVIINANDRLPLDAPAPFITEDWAPPFRARRIAERLRVGDGSLSESVALQHDTASLMARAVLPLMTGIAARTDDETWALSKLRTWNHTMVAGRVEPLLFAAWLRELNRNLYADELGPLFSAYFGYRPLFVKSVLSGRDHWCDDVTTAPMETCVDALRTSLARALVWLGERYGEDRAAWRWGAAHRARFAHPLFMHVPVLGELTTLEVTVGGGNATLARATSRIADDAAPFVAVHGAGYRAVYDLADLARSRFVIATGQSGNPLSAHYRDFVGLWRDGHTVTIDAADTGTPRLLLSPPDGS